VWIGTTLFQTSSAIKHADSLPKFHIRITAGGKPIAVSGKPIAVNRRAVERVNKIKILPVKINSEFCYLLE
jgi:hypothetical protein